MNAPLPGSDSFRDPIEGIARVVGAPEGTRLPSWLRVVHWAILVNFGLQCVYAAWQVFVVLQPEGTIGPMFGAAAQLPHELMMARRAYAAEGWLAFIGLSVYVGITEILPRRARDLLG